MRRSTRTRSPIVVLLVAGLLATLAAPALATPQVRSFGRAIDAYARYDGQTRCVSTEQPGVRDFRALLQRTYGANGGGILRPCGSGGRSEHKEGRAYDWMVNAHRASEKAMADELLRWLLKTDEHGNRHAMARRFGIMYIIWNGRTWSAYRPHDGWVRYTGSNPHTDHVHFSFSWAGARRETTYWTAPTVATATPGPFRDVHGEHRFVREITWAVDESIVSGHSDGRFRPGASITRAHMASFLWRFMGRPQVNKPHGFVDVPLNSPFDPAIRWLKDAGVTGGVNATHFGPDRPVTRGQMATFLWKLVGSPDEEAEHDFADVPPGHRHEDGVVFLVRRTITSGAGPQRYGVNQDVTRGQMTAFLWNLAGRRQAWRDADDVPTSVRFD